MSFPILAELRGSSNHSDALLIISFFPYRISISCLFPASWHFSLSPVVLPRFLLPSFRQLLLLGLLAGVMGLLYLLLVTGKGQYSWMREDRHLHT